MRAPRNKCGTLLLLVVACSAAAQEQSVFRAGTRLVEVDVVVRDKNGPVRGLTKDDFTLFDCKASERDANRSLQPCKGGKRQPLDVFREVNASASPAGSQGTAPPTRLPPGAVSNRVYSDGKTLTSATVVLFDQLNTPFDLKGYERLHIARFLQSIGDKNRIALYSLGQDLHILQDFTDDPQKLIQAVAKLDSGDQLTPAEDPGVDSKIAAVAAQVYGDAARQTSVDAIRKIIQHMEGVPGRKNLVWIAQGFDTIFNPRFGPPLARILLGQANIAVYPVMVRSLQGSGVLNMRASPRPQAPPMPDLEIQFRNRKLGESLGGSGFSDAADVLAAVRTAEEDAGNYYVLGFYPAEKDLDGSTHQLTLEVAKKVAARPELVLHYRQVYLASKPASATPEQKPSVGDLFRSPLDATAIGLTAAIVADPAKPGRRQIQATVDLADVQLRPEKGRVVGSLQMASRFEYKEADVLMVTEPIVQTVSISLSDAELAATRTSGFQVTQPMPDGLKPGAAHIVVQDAANGAAGSLRVPIPGGVQ